MIVDHVCYAVKNLEEGISYWQQVFGYRQMTSIVENTRQKVRVVFLTMEDSVRVKLIEPLEGNQALQNFVNRGGGYHHICFRCQNMNQTISTLNQKGLLTLVKPQPGEAFNNHDIAFLLGKYGMNIELIDTDEKAYMLPIDLSTDH